VIGRKFRGAIAIDATEWHSRIALQFDARYKKSAAFKERLEVWTRLIGTYAPAGCTALDAGCGSGVLSFVAAERCRSVLGIDASHEMIMLCEKKRRQQRSINTEFREFQLKDLTALGCEQFDVILCSSVLEYVEDFWSTIDAMCLNLSEGGVLLFSVPNRSSVYRKLERLCFKLTGHPAYFGSVRSGPSRRAIESGLAKRGLQIVETNYYAGTPLLSPLARMARLAHWADNLIVFVCRIGQ